MLPLLGGSLSIFVQNEGLVDLSHVVQQICSHCHLAAFLSLMLVFVDNNIDDIQRKDTGEVRQGTGSLNAAFRATVEKQLRPQPCEVWMTLQSTQQGAWKMVTRAAMGGWVGEPHPGSPLCFMAK